MWVAEQPEKPTQLFGFLMARIDKRSFKFIVTRKKLLKHSSIREQFSFI